MAIVPAVPTFTTGQTPPLATLNQLSACVAFACTIPAFCEMTGSQTLANSTTTALTWTETVDRDGGHSNSVNPTRYTAQTPGYYGLTADVAFATNSSGVRLASFQVTTGSGNPGGAGNTVKFGLKSSTPAGGLVTRINLAAMTPYMYVGDYVEVYAFQSSGSGLSTATSYWQILLESLGP